MIRKIFLFGIICLSLTCIKTNSVQAQRNIFSKAWNVTELEKVVVQRWEPYPVYADRLAWDALPADAREQLLNDASLLKGKSYEFLPLHEYLAFTRDGNRNRYEKIYFGRRSQLLQVLMAECAEGKGRFRDDILNGIWTICEESSWCIPAHIGQKDGIPDLSKPIVDLFSAETAALLAYTDFLYGSELEKISPLLRKRLRKEIKDRILKPFLERNDFWWMGFGGGAVNNWNPWILSNILPAALLVEEDRAVQLQLVNKSLLCLDNFTNSYPADGGCDEGPSYWSRAGASLFDCLETLYSASKGSINYYDNPLIMNIGQYIYKAFIHEPWYINFADAAAQLQPDAFVIFDYGRRIDDKFMTGFGAMLDSGKSFTVSRRLQSIGRSLPHLFSLNEIRLASGAWPYLRDSWLPDLEVMAARTSSGTPEGLFFAAKGGNNGENHNHNDVGNFIVYYNGQPAIIDAGVGAYTAKTFSSDRYSIWSMQSQYHNLPTINGVMQEAGVKFAASNPVYLSGETRVRFSLELSSCYPTTAAVQQWDRKFDFKRGKEIILTDDFKLAEIKGITSWNFITCLKPLITKDGCITLSSNGEYKTACNILVLYSGADLDAVIEEIELLPSDGYQWKSNLYRIVLTPESMKSSGEFRFIIRPENGHD